MRSMLISLLFGFLLLFPVTIFAGDLDPPAGPEDAGSAMYCLEDIYHRLEGGTGCSKRTGPFREPEAGPISGTGHTLDEIMEKAPVADDVNGAVPADVSLGRTYWGLRTDGTWGPQTGTAAACPPSCTGDATAADVLAGKTFSNAMSVNLTGALATKALSAGSRAVEAGYYTATTLDAVDGDLVAGNIKGGVTIFGVAGTLAATGVPKTGQTATYGTRDDGALERGVAWPSPRFTDNGNGTVTDNLTGLIWLKQANYKNTSGETGWVIWLEALAFCNALQSGQCGLTDGSSVGDWRLPNVRELQSLIDYGKCNPALPMDHPFSNVQSYLYWSGSTYACVTVGAWRVDMGSGAVSDNAKVENGWVWPVRGGN